LQFARLPALHGQVAFRRLYRALQVVLHRGHVVHRFGQQAGQFLYPGVAVELQGVKAGIGLAALRQARLHLHFGLQLQVAQLAAQTLDVAAHVLERLAQATHVVFQTGTGNHHVASLGHELVQQIGTHAHRAGTCGGRLGQHRHLRWAQAFRGLHLHALSERCLGWPARRL